MAHEQPSDAEAIPLMLRMWWRWATEVWVAAPEGSSDLIETLLDLARHGQEADSRFLAGSSGVKAEELDELWLGTVARLTP